MNDELGIGEAHPMAYSAYKYVKHTMTGAMLESLASCAIEGNRAAEICLGTWNRLEKGAPVSDRYILGLAWMVKEMKAL